MNLSTSSETTLEPILFALPDIGEEEIAEVVQCLRSGWLTSGPKVRQFEIDIATYIGHDVQAVAVSSATEGLLLALEALGIKAGDEVITTTYTFSATAMSIYHLGATPILVDVDPVTMNMDVAKIEQAITPRTKAIIPVHFAGLVCDMQAILQLAKKHQLKVIEDAAHALPTRYQGKLVGGLESDATVFSFYATKPITTGEGGMILSRHQEVIDRCKIMRLHGISRDVFDRYTSLKANWHYDIVAPGYKCNMTDIAASIGSVQLRKADAFQMKRQSIANQYHQAFASLPLILPANAHVDDLHSWHLYTIRLNTNVITRDEFINKMKSEYAVGCSVHFIPLHHHPFWRSVLDLSEAEFPVADNIFDKVVSLPIYTKMTQSQIDRVIEAVTNILASNK